MAIADTPWREGDLVQRDLPDGTMYRLRIDSPIPGSDRCWHAVVAAIACDHGHGVKVGDPLDANTRLDRKVMQRSTRMCAVLNCPGAELCPFPPLGRRCEPGWGGWRSRR